MTDEWSCLLEVGNEYKLFEEALTFDLALAACEEQNATLATLRSEVERAFAQELNVNSTFQGDLWIGKLYILFPVFLSFKFRHFSV